jgi:molybdate transport system ATP-binding protein
VIAADLRQHAGSYSVTVLFGPSGCGKTTLLRCLAGLERPDAGRILFGNETWYDSGQHVFRRPQERDVGFMFQDYALFPHRSVEQNIGYGLGRIVSAKRRLAVGELLDRFQLTGLANRYPHQISGGQQQRVALARAVARRPRLLLLDEPLSALDSTLRDNMRSQLRRNLGDFKIPVIVVTHDRIEAIALADQIVVMESGRVRQSGPVHEVFMHPADLNVARIIGIETVQAGEVLAVEDGLATVSVAGVRLLAVAPAEDCRRVHVCIRGEDVTLQRQRPGETSARNHLPAVIKWLTPEGALVRVGLDCGFELTALVTRPACAELDLTVGEQVTALVKAPAVHLMPFGESRLLS